MCDWIKIKIMQATFIFSLNHKVSLQQVALHVRFVSFSIMDAPPDAALKGLKPPPGIKPESFCLEGK